MLRAPPSRQSNSQPSLLAREINQAKLRAREVLTYLSGSSKKGSDAHVLHRRRHQPKTVQDFCM
jgi:hypothetical protein